MKSSVLLCAAVCFAGCAAESASRVPPQRTPQLRGVIEGFYGPPYTHEDRLFVLESLPDAGFSAYFYGPKADPYHRESWREPYPEGTLDHFGALTARGREIGVRFVFTLSPGLSYDPFSSDEDVLLAKLDAVFDRGVRDFCLFFDDLYPSSPGSDPAVQVALLRSVRNHLRQRDASATLCFTPPYYSGTAQELAADAKRVYPIALPDPSSVHYAAYASLPRDIAMFWTGPGIFSTEITEAHVRDFRAFVGREVFVWDNFPVNDTVVADELFLGPYYGRSPRLGESIDGVVLNLAQQPRASAIAIRTCGDALREGDAYDPKGAHTQALDALGGAATAALVKLAEQCAGHPLVADGGEAVRLAGLVEAFTLTPSATSAMALRTELEDLEDVRSELEAALPDARLYAELAPFATKLEALASAGLLALDAYVVASGGGTPDLIALDAVISAARSMKPVVGANTTIEPWLFPIVGDTVVSSPVDVWAGFFDAIRQATTAATSSP